MATELRRPPMLAAGDRVAVATLSWAGAHDVPDRFDVGVAQLEEAFGVEVVELAHTRASQDELVPLGATLQPPSGDAGAGDGSILVQPGVTATR